MLRLVLLESEALIDALRLVPAWYLSNLAPLEALRLALKLLVLAESEVTDALRPVLKLVLTESEAPIEALRLVLLVLAESGSTN